MRGVPDEAPVVPHLQVRMVILAVRDPEMDQRRLLLDCSAGAVNPLVATQ